MRELIDLYLEQRARRRLRPRSLIELERHLLVKAKRLHGMACTDIGRTEIAGLLTRVAGSAPVQANRLRASLSALFAWAMTQGIVENNPVVGTAKPSEEASRSRVLTLPELAAVWRAADSGSAFDSIVSC